jgi:hypothetical protein
MKAVYQIKRIPLSRGFRFDLVNTYTLGVVMVAYGISPIAPIWIRRRQAVLNTAAVLDVSLGKSHSQRIAEV